MVFNTLNSVAYDVNFYTGSPMVVYFYFLREGEPPLICETSIHIEVNDSSCITAKYLFETQMSQQILLFLSSFHPSEAARNNYSPLQSLCQSCLSQKDHLLDEGNEQDFFL